MWNRFIFWCLTNPELAAWWIWALVFAFFIVTRRH